MILTLDNERLRTLIPNIIHEVEGETLLYDKILPWINSARVSLETDILGTFQPEGELYALTEKIVVYKAFAEAIPSLDLTLSPAGFAVINTDGRAPASKERVERLVASLNSSVDANIIVLVSELHKQELWASTPIGAWFRDSFVPDLNDVTQFRRDKDLLTTYCSMRAQALRFEQEIGELYLGRDFIRSLKEDYPAFETPGSREIHEMIRAAELCYISCHLRDQKVKCPDEHEVWHLVRPVIARLDYWQDLKEAWLLEMGDKIKVEPFKNTVKGGFFF